MTSSLVESASASLAAAMAVRGQPVCPRSLRRIRDTPRSIRGLLDQMALASKALGDGCRVSVCGRAQLCSVQCPAMLLWNAERFIVLLLADESQLFVLDPKDGTRSLELQDSAEGFSGVFVDV